MDIEVLNLFSKFDKATGDRILKIEQRLAEMEKLDDKIKALELENVELKYKIVESGMSLREKTEIIEEQRQHLSKYKKLVKKIDKTFNDSLAMYSSEWEQLKKEAGL